mmetsp:Transcript_16899/g.64364  ORF Transcript_16899/g.64364 Transcript_16899/m.64364 type:complete len:403 (+) Transcript_16899:35-1243(+)
MAPQHIHNVSRSSSTSHLACNKTQCGLYVSFRLVNVLHAYCSSRLIQLRAPLDGSGGDVPVCPGVHTSFRRLIGGSRVPSRQQAERAFQMLDGAISTLPLESRFREEHVLQRIVLPFHVQAEARRRCRRVQLSGGLHGRLPPRVVRNRLLRSEATHRLDLRIGLLHELGGLCEAHATLSAQRRMDVFGARGAGNVQHAGALRHHAIYGGGRVRRRRRALFLHPLFNVLLILLLCERIARCGPAALSDGLDDIQCFELAVLHLGRQALIQFPKLLQHLDKSGHRVEPLCGGLGGVAGAVLLIGHIKDLQNEAPEQDLHLFRRELRHGLLLRLQTLHQAQQEAHDRLRAVLLSQHHRFLRGVLAAVVRHEARLGLTAVAVQLFRAPDVAGHRFHRRWDLHAKGG